MMDWTLFWGILAVVFFVATIVLVFKFAKREKPVWARNTRRIIGIGTDAPPELKMTFRGLPVDDVYQTLFVFFNKGTETIRKADVAEAVAIHFEGAKILRQPIALAMSKETNKLSVRGVIKDGDEAVEVDFLYLDHDDGVMVEVLHTKSERVRCSGIIMGASEIGYIGEFLRRPPPYLLIPIVFAGFSSLVGYVVYTMLHDVASTILATQSKYLLILPIGFSLFVIVYWVRFIVKQLPVFYRYLRFPKWTGLHTRTRKVVS